jgi:hypothetical protein
MKLALASSVVAAVASIAVAYIGILPGLHGDDGKVREKEEEIDGLRKRLQQLEAANGVLPSEAGVRWTISGSVRRAQNGSEPGQYEVYLVPGNKYVALTSDDGRFVFDGLFPASYALVVRDVDSRSNRAVRGLITPDDPTGSLDSHGARIEYRVTSAPASPQPHLAVIHDGSAPGSTLAAIVVDVSRTPSGGRP